MRSIVSCPTASGLVQVSARRRRTGRTVVDVHPGPDPSCHLAVALAVLLSDPAHKHLRRSGWVAWGSLHSNGSLTPAESPLTNDLPLGPCVGQIWHPDDHLPSPDEDAVLTTVGVTDLQEAWDALSLFATMEDAVFALEGVSQRNTPAAVQWV